MTESPRAGVAALLHMPHARGGGRAGQVDMPAVRPASVLAVSSMTLFLLGVSATGINAALGGIASDIGMGANGLSWAVGVYLLAVAAFVAPGGRLGDLVGERTAFLLGILLFGGAAVVVAAASVPWMMILGRALQGVGTAVLLPGTVAVLRIAYRPERQGFALGVWGAVGGLSFALGPLIGGGFTDTLGWRWLWWVTAAIMAGTAAATGSVLKAMPVPERRPKVDAAGVVLLPLSLFALILAIQQGPVWGWGSAASVSAFAVSVASLAALIAVERRLDEPLLHLSLLRTPELLAANLVAFVNVFVLIGVLYFVNLFTQAGATLGYSALTASLALLPYAACTFGASLLGGRLCDRIGVTLPVAGGLALLAFGAWALSRFDAGAGYADLWWPLALLGLGVGVTSVAPFAVGLRAVGPEQAGEVSGVINVVRYLAAALVVSVGTVLFAGVGTAHLNRSLTAAGVPELEFATLDAVLSGAASRVAAVERGLGMSAAQVDAFRTGAAEGITAGFAATMLGLALVSLVTCAVWLLLVRRTEPVRDRR